MKVISVLTGLVALTVSVSSLAISTRDDKCKCFPGDACWPSDQDWTAFNATVGGRLIKTVPLGSPCHDPNYDAALCKELTAQWKLAPVHINSSSSIQAAIFADASCDPFTPRSSACSMGNYVNYAVNVTGPEDVAATLQFASKTNIRLVIRNTAHDYMGRSTGAGGLAIWTHHLKGVEVKDWSSDEYTGKAIKIGAGVQGSEALQTAYEAGLVVVTGECPTVGLGGGYTMSGGHSPLSTAFGLSADNTLEFEVVTADGQLVRAGPSTEHADLFWALSGSGSGAYGVVVSMTLRAHPDKVTSGASFQIADPSLDYGAVLAALHSALPQIVDSGTQVTYLVNNQSATVFSVSGYDKSQTDIESTMQPFVASMAAMNFTLTPNYTQFPSYHDHYLHYFGPLPAGLFGSAGDQLMGGRLLPRAAAAATTNNNGLSSALSTTLDLGVNFIGQAMNVSRFASSHRAVLPQWRSALVMSAYSMPYSTDVPFAAMASRQDFITDTVMPVIEAATPGAGAYINEADFQQRDWQSVFYGANYADLVAVKAKYDPADLFWNSIAPGSEGWGVVEGGKLCRTGV